jgi:type IV secretory pathway VirB10-like protein
MRTDYILYVIAVICFIVAGLTAARPYTSAASNWLIVIVLAIIGVIFVGGGYSLRPQTRVVTRAEPKMPQAKPMMEEQKMTPPVAEPSPEPEPTPVAEPVPTGEASEETKKEEAAPLEAVAETSQVKTETKRPVRRRREKKEVKEA